MASKRLNSKHEARNTKQYQMTQIQMLKTMFRILRIRILNLFRISDFGFRICSTRAFTAVELMIVLAIMGIMLVAAMPSFVQFTRNSRIKSGAQIVVSALRTARSHAITKRKNCRVIVDTVMNAVKIYEDDTGTLTNWKVMPKTIVISHNIQSGDHLSMPYPDDSVAVGAYKSKPTVEFKPTGATSTGATPVTIQVSDDDKTNPDTSYIKIEGLTGRVKTSRDGT